MAILAFVLAAGSIIVTVVTTVSYHTTFSRLEQAFVNRGNARLAAELQKTCWQQRQRMHDYFANPSSALAAQIAAQEAAFEATLTAIKPQSRARRLWIRQAAVAHRRPDAVFAVLRGQREARLPARTSRTPAWTLLPRHWTRRWSRWTPARLPLRLTTLFRQTVPDSRLLSPHLEW